MFTPRRTLDSRSIVSSEVIIVAEQSVP